MNATVLSQAAGAAEPVHRAEDLLAGRDKVRIVLGDQTYILRLTRAGKLILTK